MIDRPLSYWVTVARMGFENDFNRLFGELRISRTDLAKRVKASPAYISKVLNGTGGNYQLGTMAKWARAFGAIVQIRLIKEGEEVVRVVDYEMASTIDDMRDSQAQSSAPKAVASGVVVVDFESRSRASSNSAAIVTEEYRVASGG